MKNKTFLIIGILGILLAVGVMSVAMAQDTSSEKTKDAQSHECTPEMMENMSENCPEQSVAGENMMNGSSGMMDNNKEAENAETEGSDHCGGMSSEESSDSSASTAKVQL